LPNRIKEEIQKNRVNIIKASDLDARTIYQWAVDKAVADIELIWPAYARENQELIAFNCRIMGTNLAKTAYKKRLCERLAHFYSANEVYRRICKHLEADIVKIIPDVDVGDYTYIENLLVKSGLSIRQKNSLRFSATSSLASKLTSSYKVGQLLAKTFFQALFSLFASGENKNKAKYFDYRYGVTILSPRQLRNNRRSPDFFVDGELIDQNDVIYYIMFPPKKSEWDIIRKRYTNLIVVPTAGKFFSNPEIWFLLLSKCLKPASMGKWNEIRIACITLFQFLLWKCLLKKYRPKNFITHCDFSITQISRNICLKEVGAVTWYFNDSMNFGNNLLGYIPNCQMRHPFWTFLNYDHLVTWHKSLADYFKAHEGSFKETHVVGCLWADHIVQTNNTSNNRLKMPFKKSKSSFKIAVFDTTYSRNITINYLEGLEYAKQIIRISKINSYIEIAFKEKKDRKIHSRFDQDYGPKLVKLYELMDSMENIYMVSNQHDSSELIYHADLIISFPFTSTTFEALSGNKTAIWHDPLDLYRNNVYSQIDGLVTHGFHELEAVIEDTRLKKQKGYSPADLPGDKYLLDPYRDGNAIARFRKLLIESSSGVGEY